MGVRAGGRFLYPESAQPSSGRAVDSGDERHRAGVCRHAGDDRDGGGGRHGHEGRGEEDPCAVGGVEKCDGRLRACGGGGDVWSASGEGAGGGKEKLKSEGRSAPRRVGVGSFCAGPSGRKRVAEGDGGVIAGVGVFVFRRGALLEEMVAAEGVGEAEGEL
jgi:hypothetical protein